MPVFAVILNGALLNSRVPSQQLLPFHASTVDWSVGVPSTMNLTPSVAVRF